MTRFLMELFARHDWTATEETRYCTVCHRREVAQFEHDEFADSVGWACVDEGDVMLHWWPKRPRAPGLPKSDASIPDIPA